MSEPQKDLFVCPKETSLEDQWARQRLSSDWEPRGFHRYTYQRALVKKMPVLGGPGDQLLPESKRYQPSPECQDTLDCHCGE